MKEYLLGVAWILIDEGYQDTTSKIGKENFECNLKQISQPNQFSSNTSEAYLYSVQSYLCLFSAWKCAVKQLR